MLRAQLKQKYRIAEVAKCACVHVASVAIVAGKVALTSSKCSWINYSCIGAHMCIYVEDFNHPSFGLLAAAVWT